MKLKQLSAFPVPGVKDTLITEHTGAVVQNKRKVRISSCRSILYNLGNLFHVNELSGH